MAKMTVMEERLIYCSGMNWEGDGSKATSACKFGDSKQTLAVRYKCSHCAAGQTPEDIFAGADGIKKMEPKKALVKQQVRREEPVETMPAVEGKEKEQAEVKDLSPAVETAAVETAVETVQEPEAKPKESPVRRRRRTGRRRF